MAGLVLLVLASACASLGGVDDGTSLALGVPAGGVLHNAVELPVAGDGYLVPTRWSTRGLNWGTDELVGLIVRAARRVDAELPGARLYVGDLSPRTGGRSLWHRSHQTGRDADLMFYALDEAGRPAPPPDTMPVFAADGTATATVGGKPMRIRFDVARNWALVRALLEDRHAHVQYLFIAAPLKQRLLAHAAMAKERLDLIARAAAILHQPGDSLPHDDHLHLRIYCPVSDRSLGCRDAGPLRWFKKGYKYLVAPRPPGRWAEAIAGLLLRPLCHSVGRQWFVAFR